MKQVAFTATSKIEKQLTPQPHSNKKLQKPIKSATLKHTTAANCLKVYIPVRDFAINRTKQTFY
jgi:hypothetical protein